MKATIYVNFKTGEVVGEKEFRRMVGELVDKFMNPQSFNDYLEYHTEFSYGEVFYMTPEDKAKVLEDFSLECRVKAKDKLEFVKREVEI